MFHIKFRFDFFCYYNNHKHLIYIGNYNAYCMTYQRQNGGPLLGYITHRILLVKKSEHVFTLLQFYL